MKDVTGYDRCPDCGQPRLNPEFHECCTKEYNYAKLTKVETVIAVVVLGILVYAVYMFLGVTK
jgi:uncharacterized protein (DUF983 family)